METLVAQTGDVDALVAVKSRDLSEAFNFLGIAEIYKAVGDKDIALEWAERGARAFPARLDGRLREFLIEEYHRRGRHNEAMVITWTSFRERPSLDTYQGLHRSAIRANQWSDWRDKALAQLREHIAAKKSGPSKFGLAANRDHSQIAEIFLWEGDIEAAWQEARAGGCHSALWFRLAEARKKDHPEDAIAVYVEQLKPVLQWAQQSAYEQAVDILRKIQKLTVRIGKQAQFATLVESIRAQYKPRRNLMKLLDAQGWF